MHCTAVTAHGVLFVPIHQALIYTGYEYINTLSLNDLQRNTYTKELFKEPVFNVNVKPFGLCF